MAESINKTEFGKYVVPGYIHGVGLEAEEHHTRAITDRTARSSSSQT